MSEETLSCLDLSLFGLENISYIAAYSAPQVPEALGSRNINDLGDIW